MRVIRAARGRRSSPVFGGGRGGGGGLLWVSISQETPRTALCLHHPRAGRGAGPLAPRLALHAELGARAEGPEGPPRDVERDVGRSDAQPSNLGTRRASQRLSPRDSPLRPRASFRRLASSVAAVSANNNNGGCCLRQQQQRRVLSTLRMATVAAVHADDAVAGSLGCSARRGRHRELERDCREGRRERANLSTAPVSSMSGASIRAISVGPCSWRQRRGRARRGRRAGWRGGAGPTRKSHSPSRSRSRKVACAT